MTYTSALIVGAGSGLSASLARAFTKAGMTVALAARSAAKLAEFVQATGCKAFNCDAAKRDEVDKLFADLDAAQMTPDVVVYNASYRTRGPLLDLDPVEVDKAIEITAFGGFLVAQAAVQAHAAARPRRHPVHRRLGQREGLCAVGALRHGQVRAARAGAEHGARIVAEGHPRRAFRHRRRHQERAPRRAARCAGFAARSRRHRRRAICICCSSRAAPGRTSSSCGRGWRSSDFRRPAEPLRRPAPSPMSRRVGDGPASRARL